MRLNLISYLRQKCETGTVLYERSAFGWIFPFYSLAHALASAFLTVSPASFSKKNEPIKRKTGYTRMCLQVVNGRQTSCVSECVFSVCVFFNVGQDLFLPALQRSSSTMQRSCTTRPSTQTRGIAWTSSAACPFRSPEAWPSPASCCSSTGSWEQNRTSRFRPHPKFFKEEVLEVS